MRYVLGAALGLAGYAAWQWSRGTSTANQIAGAALRDPRAYGAVAAGLLAARFARR